MRLAQWDNYSLKQLAARQHSLQKYCNGTGYFGSAHNYLSCIFVSHAMSAAQACLLCQALTLSVV
jgi:hypothetical protein